jgi:hypothetical protein
MSSEQMQAAIKQLQEATFILSQIDTKQGVSPEIGPPGVRSETLWLRIDKNMAEITEKLNRLISAQ